MTDDKKPGEDPAAMQYQDLVEEEISFSKATGYDKEQTAVVPLAELARREEERLKRASRGETTLVGPLHEGPEDPRRVIPLGEIIDVLRAARTVEEVAGVLVEIIANLIPRVLLFWERDDVLYGFASRGMGLSEVKLLTMELPRSVITDMTGIKIELDSYRGPAHRLGQVPQLFEILGASPPEILLIPVYVTPQDRWVLYADNGEEALGRVESRLIEVIVSRAGARADLLMEGKVW